MLNTEVQFICKNIEIISHLVWGLKEHKEIDRDTTVYSRFLVYSLVLPLRIPGDKQKKIFEHFLVMLWASLHVEPTWLYHKKGTAVWQALYGFNGMEMKKNSYPISHHKMDSFIISWFHHKSPKFHQIFLIEDITIIINTYGTKVSISAQVNFDFKMEWNLLMVSVLRCIPFHKQAHKDKH